MDVSARSGADHTRPFLSDEQVALLPGDGVVEPPAVVHRWAAAAVCRGDQATHFYRRGWRAAPDSVPDIVEDEAFVPGKYECQAITDERVVNPIMRRDRLAVHQSGRGWLAQVVNQQRRLVLCLGAGEPRVLGSEGVQLPIETGKGNSVDPAERNA